MKPLHITAVFAVILGLTAPAWAQNSNGSFSPGVTQNSATAAGGQGGQGGAGGTGVGIGGSAQQQQGQSQGQQQGQAQHQGQGQFQGQGQTYEGQQSTSVNFEGTKFDRYAPPVAAPGLTAAGTGVCLGSVSIGLSGPMAGASFGITKVDKGCEQRSAAALLYQMGYKDAAVRLLMKNDDVREAMGTDAPKTAKVAIQASAPIEPVTVSSAAIFSEPVLASTPASVQGN